MKDSDFLLTGLTDKSFVVHEDFSNKTNILGLGAHHIFFSFSCYLRFNKRNLITVLLLVQFCPMHLVGTSISPIKS